MTPEKNRTSETELELKAMWESLELTLGLVQKVNVYSDDETDEFGVIRENGKREGIFKTWAVPVIPFLELGLERDLAEAMQTMVGGNF